MSFSPAREALPPADSKGTAAPDTVPNAALGGEGVHRVTHSAVPYKTALSLSILGSISASEALFRLLQGHSSTMIRTLGIEYTTKYLTVRGDLCKVQIWAQMMYPGKPEARSYSWKFSGLVFAIDLADSSSLSLVTAWLAQVTAQRPPATFACALIGALAEGKERVVAAAEGAALAAQYGAPYAEAVGSSSLEEAVSALAASALDKLPLIAAAREEEKQQSQRAQGGCGCAIV